MTMFSTMLFILLAAIARQSHSQETSIRSALCSPGDLVSTRNVTVILEDDPPAGWWYRLIKEARVESESGSYCICRPPLLTQLVDPGPRMVDSDMLLRSERYECDFPGKVSRDQLKWKIQRKYPEMARLNIMFKPGQSRRLSWLVPAQNTLPTTLPTTVTPQTTTDILNATTSEQGLLNSTITTTDKKNSTEINRHLNSTEISHTNSTEIPHTNSTEIPLLNSTATFFAHLSRLGGKPTGIFQNITRLVRKLSGAETVQ